MNECLLIYLRTTCWCICSASRGLKDLWYESCCFDEHDFLHLPQLRFLCVQVLPPTSLVSILFPSSSAACLATKFGKIVLGLKHGCMAVKKWDLGGRWIKTGRLAEFASSKWLCLELFYLLAGLLGISAGIGLAQLLKFPESCDAYMLDRIQSQYLFFGQIRQEEQTHWAFKSLWRMLIGLNLCCLSSASCLAVLECLIRYHGWWPSVPSLAAMASMLGKKASLLALVALHLHDRGWRIESSGLLAPWPLPDSWRIGGVWRCNSSTSMVSDHQDLGQSVQRRCWVVTENGVLVYFGSFGHDRFHSQEKEPSVLESDSPVPGASSHSRW